MGISRALWVVAALSTILVAGPSGAWAVGARPSPGQAKATVPDMEFYLARGEGDACGRGCSEWIAAEGRIDLGAAQRLRRLLGKLGARRPPIYFHSPGGAVVGSLALGRLIRDRKLQTGVAHTVPFGCDRDKPFEKSCQAQKRSGLELSSEFDPAGGGMCNSACVFALIGGVARLVPPGIKLGIHDISLDAPRPLPEAVALKAKQLIHLQIQQYFREMGIDRGLYAALVAVPNSSKRFLEREELVRLGIDRREFGETSWRFIERPKPAIGKIFFARFGGERPQYHTGLARLDCPSGKEIRIVLAREHVVSDASRTRPFSISVGGQHIELNYPTFSTDLDTRSTWLRGQGFDAVQDDTKFEVRAIDVAGGDEAGNIALSMDGFSRAYAKLKSSCEQAPTPVQLRVGTSNYDPSTNPNCRPGGDQLKCLQGDTRLQSSAQSPPPNVFASVPAANVVRAIPIGPNEQHTAMRSPTADAVSPESPAAPEWMRGLVLQIARNQRYPAGANGEAGTATLALRIDRSGHLVASRLVQSSGSAILDEASLALVRRAEPFPAPPADVPDAQLSFVLPIHYAAPLGHRQ